MGNRSAIYAGTFDPVTNGHLDIISRGAKLFDDITIAVSEEGRSTLFDYEERIAMITEAVISSSIPNCKVVSFKGLLVDTMREYQATIAIRGVRSAAELYDEQQMALMNSILDSNVESVILFAKPSLSMISASLVREVARCGGELTEFVPVCVAKKLHSKFA
ncbi:pantetheine-phosphate adenylyltransferase [bacterium]|jgi:pantetheine-phosphate adenylyltransferase|nr:pantetheine-phosphate adenylyltransferase [bacterium]MBT4291438.1 pantetheine-phosphate adenylyltransferase [bacterium]MBT7310125.1 pantetheine-phosphate adenylyltransferase [bacterium]